MYAHQELTCMIEKELAGLSYPAVPEGLYTPIRYALEGGGKRIRPVLALMACNVWDESVEEALPVALAVEMFHNFTLLHDDMMDRSETRRGRAAVHKKWDENTAILSGDQMCICAYRLLARSRADLLPHLLEAFNDITTGVCEGQQYDMDFERREDVSVAEYLEMIRLKTSVLLGGSLRLGAICGGASREASDRLYDFGIDLGLAFQVQDDWLDTYGDATLLGKPVGGDILSGKKNFLLSSALSVSDASTRGRLLVLLHDKALAPAEKIEAVKSIYDRLGLSALTEEKIAGYFTCALSRLEDPALPAGRLAPLRELATGLMGRKK